ncbi:unnamed protein product, partial [Amoebophrya sp. A120]|eukprot:GSA120T00017360001.1
MARERGEIVNEQLLEIISLAEAVEAELLQYQQALPLLCALRSKGMKDRHWREVSLLEPTPHWIHPYRRNIPSDLADSKTFSTEVNQELEAAEKSSKELPGTSAPGSPRSDAEVFNFDNSNRFRAWTLRNGGTIEALLQRHVGRTSVLLANEEYNLAYRDEIVTWDGALKRALHCVQTWLRVQELWRNLGPVFDHLQDWVLQQAQRQFEKETEFWHSLKHQALQSPNALAALLGVSFPEPDLLARLQKSQQVLEGVQYQVRKALQRTRCRCGRLFWLAEAELLHL